MQHLVNGNMPTPPSLLRACGFWYAQQYASVCATYTLLLNKQLCKDYLWYAPCAGMHHICAIAALFFGMRRGYAQDNSLTKM